MKKILAAVFALATAAVFAGANDLLISFSTPGPDKYADGTTVLDGELYSLVWTAADGTQETLVSLPLAKDGKCGFYYFVIDEGDVAKKYKGGTWGVYLLDTRDFVNDPTGKTLSAIGEDGKPATVNVTAVVKDGIAKTSGFASASVKDGVAAGAYDLAAANVPDPKVTGIKIVGANVIVTVKDTVPFVGYTLQAGDDTINFAVPEGATSASGNDANEISLIAPKKEGAQFFKVSTIK